MNSSTSIYIPRMSSLHTVESIKNIMSAFRIGTVERVDFTTINKKPGFGENVNDVLMSAFVHFSDPILGYDNCYNYMSDSFLGNNNFWNDIASNQPYKLQIAHNQYWICLNNKNPVQRTRMNIHQVVENGRHLENLIEKQNEEIKNLREIIEIQENKFCGLHEVVYQLIGGLYNQSSQSGIIDVHLNSIELSNASNNNNSNSNNNSNYNNSSNNSSKWGIWPTTRQGDKCEHKIKKLEHDIRYILNLNHSHAAVTPNFDEIHYNTVVDDDDDYCYDNESPQDNELLIRKKRDNDSISRHSIMSSSIEYSDIDDESINSHSSMPSLIPWDCYSREPI
jgi:hypothetical protein